MTMPQPRDYLRDGEAIYRQSFAIIRAETDLSRFAPDEADVVVRMIHACGNTDAARLIEFGHGLAAAARAALQAGATIFCDSEMVAHGVTRARLPAARQERAGAGGKDRHHPIRGGCRTLARAAWWLGRGHR